MNFNPLFAVIIFISFILLLKYCYEDVKKNLTIVIMLICLVIVYLLNINFIHEQFRKLNKLKRE
jgi:hypothetical protein